MNRNWYLPFISLALLLFAFSACDDKPEDTLSSLTIKSNYETLYDNSEDFFSFSVTGNDDVDYTSEATFYVNSSAITGSTYSTTTAGTYTVYAQYNDIQSNSITVEVFSSIINIQSMTIASNVTECVINDEAFIFSVSGLQFDGTTLNLTNREGLKIFVDSALINGNSFTPTEEKNYTVHATFNDTISSNSITVTGLPNPNIYVHKVLIEDFTGTWCQWCPRVSHSIELVHRRTENVVVAALHRGASAGSQYDPFNLADAGALESALGVIGYPTAFINRSTAWTSPENNNVSQPIDMIKEGSAYGIYISSELTTTSGTIDVSITFNKDLSNAKVVVYVMEDLQLTLGEMVEIKAEDLTPYGLDDPSMEFWYKSGETDIHLLLGDKTEDGNIYAKLFDREQVFLMEYALVESLYGLDPLSVVEKFIALVYIDDCERIIVDHTDPSLDFELVMNHEVLPPKRKRSRKRNRIR